MKKTLSDCKWTKVKVFGDDGILSIKSSESGIDSNKLSNGEQLIVPYVTRSEIDNGISKFIDISNYEKGFDLPNTISIGLDTQTAFYQSYKYVTGQNIQVVSSDYLNRSNALFLTELLKKQMKTKLNWGGNGATLGRLKRLDILVPTIESNSFDFNFMFEYSNSKQIKLLKKYKAFATKIINRITINKVPSLTDIEWKPFSIDELFDKTQIIGGKSKGLVHLKIVNKDGINYLGATNRNNGVLCYVDDSNTIDMIQKGNCICFIKNGDGSAGYAVYKDESFIATSDILVAYANWINKYTGLFFVVAQDKIKQKYSHGYKRNQKHLLADKIMLPANSKGAPDFEYMEQYTKNLMYKKYSQYLNYIKSLPYGDKI